MHGASMEGGGRDVLMKSGGSMLVGRRRQREGTRSVTDKKKSQGTREGIKNERKENKIEKRFSSLTNRSHTRELLRMEFSHRRRFDHSNLEKIICFPITSFLGREGAKYYHLCWRRSDALLSLEYFYKNSKARFNAGCVYHIRLIVSVMFINHDIMFFSDTKTT